MNLVAIDQETWSTKTLVATAYRSTLAAAEMKLWRSVFEAGRHALASLRTWRIL